MLSAFYKMIKYEYSRFKSYIKHSADIVTCNNLLFNSLKKSQYAQLGVNKEQSGIFFCCPEKCDKSAISKEKFLYHGCARMC